MRHIHSVLYRVLEQAIAWDWIVFNPARRATPPPARRPGIHLPSADEVVQLIEAAHGVNSGLPTFLRLSLVRGAASCVRCNGSTSTSVGGRCTSQVRSHSQRWARFDVRTAGGAVMPVLRPRWTSTRTTHNRPTSEHRTHWRAASTGPSKPRRLCNELLHNRLGNDRIYRPVTDRCRRWGWTGPVAKRPSAWRA